MVKRTRSRRKRNLALLLTMGIGVVALVWASFPSGQPPSNMSGADVHLSISMAGWSPSQVSARAGVPTSFMLMTDASEASMSDNVHSFVMNQTGTSIRVVAGQTATFSVTFPHAGIYTFWYTTCCGGLKSPSMEGSVIVS